MRKVLTSVWLDEARKRGLDAAIIKLETLMRKTAAANAELAGKAARIDEVAGIDWLQTTPSQVQVSPSMVLPDRPPNSTRRRRIGS